MESHAQDADRGAGDSSSQPGLRRVRVWIRGEGGEKVPMVGLVGREGLQRLRDLQASLSESQDASLAVAARLKRLEPVFLKQEGAAPAPGRRVLLGMRVEHRAMTRKEVGPVEMREELRGFISESEWLRQNRAWVESPVAAPAVEA